VKNFIHLITFCLFINSCTSPQVLSIREFQDTLVEEWANPKTTPLKEDEKQNFKGISFFPINKKYIVEAGFTKVENGKTLPFPTSAKKIKYYTEYGKLNFELDNKPFELTVYQSDPPLNGYEDYLFLPFTDNTNGDSSYGGGRYIDFKINDIQNGRLTIDFNKAYNPYCAYSKYYNCPIPPANNYLDIEILAGVSYRR